MLVGGLGMGFTLRAVLDVLPSNAVVTVAELVPAVIEWNRELLAALAGHPLRDRRVRIQVADVGFTLRANPGRFDVVLLDVDNGPAAFTAAANAGLYDNGGVAAAFAALRPGGTLAVWSAWEDRKFEQRLRYHGFLVEVTRVRARLQKGGPRHTIFLGTSGRRTNRERYSVFKYASSAPTRRAEHARLDLPAVAHRIEPGRVGAQLRAERVAGVGLARHRRVVFLDQHAYRSGRSAPPGAPPTRSRRALRRSCRLPRRNRAGRVAGHTSWPSVGTEPLCRYGACAQMPCSMSAL